MEGLSALQIDECSKAQTLTIPRDLYEISGEMRAPGPQSTFHSYNSDAISSMGGAADQALQDRALLTAKGIDKTSATSCPHVRAIMPIQANPHKALLIAARIHATSAENAMSPFLSLPQEVKDRVYELMCGGNLVHVDCTTNCKLTHHICEAVVTENDAQQILHNTQGLWSASDITQRHPPYYNRGLWDCLDHDADHTSSKPGPCRLDLRFLRTCKQVYREAKWIPFTSNTFFFDRPPILHAFLACNPDGARVPNATLIREVKLGMVIDYADNEEIWFGALTTIALQLNSLQRLHVDLDFRPYARCSQKGYLLDLFQKQFIKSLVELTLPHLRTIILILSDCALDQARSMKDQKQEWSEYIGDVLRPKSREGDSLDGQSMYACDWLLVFDGWPMDQSSRNQVGLLSTRCLKRRILNKFFSQ